MRPHKKTHINHPFLLFTTYQLSQRDPFDIDADDRDDGQGLSCKDFWAVPIYFDLDYLSWDNHCTFTKERGELKFLI